MATAQLLVGYLVLVVMLVNAGNDRMSGKRETLNVEEGTQGGREKLDEMLDGYKLAQALSNHPRLIYSDITKQILSRALGDAKTLGLGRPSTIVSLTCASHVYQVIDDLSVPELYALNSEYSMYALNWEYSVYALNSEYSMYALNSEYSMYALNCEYSVYALNRVFCVHLKQ